MSSYRIAILPIVVVLAVSLAAPAALGKGKGKGHGNSAAISSGVQRSGSGHDDHGGSLINIGVYFGYDARQAVHSYHQSRGCPPGLAKKRNGCLPPGQAKKRYGLGSRLPSHLHVDPVPEGLYAHIGLPPSGHYYGYVDGDLLLIANATHKVIDAIVAVDAAMNGASR